MIIFVIGYVIAVVVMSRILVRHIEYQWFAEADAVERQYQALVQEKELKNALKKNLEEEAHKIFMLYELTREITRNFSEADAFGVFKAKIADEENFKDCRLVDAKDPQVQALAGSFEHWFIPLEDKKGLMAYAMLEGTSQKNNERVFILARQFSLALRRIRLYQEIEKLATTDSLTEVFTLRYILERIEEEFKRSKKRSSPLSVLMIDIDHFKKFNDLYGHLTGDQILREIAALLKQTIREIDIPGRYGGEEFCVVLPDTESHGARYVAERIRLGVQDATVKAYDASIKTTVSIGIATYPKDAHNVKDLIDKADRALYRAKGQGRNVVCS